MDPIRTKSARHPFTATRDENGVPHIVASTWHEALYAWGYMHALDRPTQLYFARAVASGRAAECIKDKSDLYEMDLFIRRAGLYRHLPRELKSLGEATTTALDQYCQGVNDGLLDAGRTLPMWVTGFQPRPWDPYSVLLIGNLLSFAGLSVGEQENERLLIELIQLGIEDERLRELFHPYLEGVNFAPFRELHIAKRLSDDMLEVLADLPRLASSNAWAVSPDRSATGPAMLASDPHLEVNRLPAIWYEIALNWGDGEYAMGATLPGTPIMAVGRTPRLAWGVTYMHADTSDFFIEECRPGGTTGWQYRRGEKWFDLAPPIVLDVYENEQGTLSCTPEGDAPGKYLSVNWVGGQSGGGRAMSTWLDVIASPSTIAAMEVARQCPHPSLVWVLADRDGHIGKQSCGWIPIRGNNNSGILPIPAWDPANHWQGKVPSELLPSEYDPPCGYVASANEELYRTDGLPLHSHTLPDYRKRRIVERITQLAKATLKDMQALQYDVTSKQADDLLPVLLPLIEDCPLKRRLSEWDRTYTLDSTEATLFQHFYRHVVLEIFGHEQGIGWRRMFYLCTRMGYNSMVLTAIDRLLPKEQCIWWRGRDKRELVRRAALRAQEEPEQTWAEFNSFHFVNRFFSGGRPLFGFRSEPIGMPGCHATPVQGPLLTPATRESSFAPSYHMVTDLGTDEAWTNLPGGPSENRFSKWYKTDIPRWLAGQYKRLKPRVES